MILFQSGTHMPDDNEPLVSLIIIFDREMNERGYNFRSG